MKSILRSALTIAIAAIVVAGAVATGRPETPATAPRGARTGAVNPLGMDDPNRPTITMTLGAVEVADTSGYPPGMTRDNNVWVDLYRDVLGVEFRNMWVVPQAQQNERVNLQIAAGDIPDILTVNMNQFNQLVEYGLIEDLTDAYETYATPRTRQVMTADGGMALSIASRQGNLYAIPFTSAIMNMTPVPWIRFDWLENLGLDVPTTTDELYDVVKAFVTQDPNGTGVADTIGFPMWAGTNINNLAFSGMLTSFNAFPSKWVKAADGSLEFSSVTSNARDALAYLRQAYADGLIPRDFGSWTDAQANEAIVAGRAGVFWWPWWAPYWMGASRDNDPTADWRPIYPPEGPNGTARLSASGVPGQFYVVRKGFEYPEMIVKMTNLFFEMQQEEENIRKYINGPNEENFWQFSKVIAWDGTGFIDEHHNMVAAVQGRNRDLVAVGNRSRYDNVIKFLDGDESEWRSYMAFGPSATYGIYSKAVETGNFELGEYYEAGTPTMLDRGGDLDTILLEEYVRIVTGAPMSQFETMVQRWRASGGTAVTNEVNEWYRGR
jgi:putative aldouronate transport system substrate-binding protein